MMKKLMLKRIGTGLVLMIFLLTAVLSMAGTKLEVYADASDFLLTHGYTRELEEGDSFTLAPLNLKNLTDKTMKNIQLDFSKAGIAVLESGGTIYNVTKNVGPGAQEDLNETPDEDKIKMRFIGDGSSNIMTVIVKYSLDGGGTIETEEAKLVFNVRKPSSSDPTPSDPSEIKPNIIATVPDNISLSAGKTSNVTVTLKNISTASSARDILFTPIYSSESPFISVTPTTEMPIKQLNINSSVELKLMIETDKFANEGLKPLKFKLTYKNSRNYEITTEYTVYIKVVNYQTNCKLVLTPSGSISASVGSTFQLPLTLKNDGNLSARDVKITLKGLSQNTFTLVSGTGRVDFERLYGNETRSLNFTLRASSSLKGGSYPITFSLVYTDEKGTVISEDQEIWIPISGGGGAVLEILEIKPSMTTVKPGDTFNIAVKIKNSGEYDSGQVKITADGTSALLPVSQNLYIVQNIKKGEEKNINFNFQPKPDAVRGGVPITIRVEPVDSQDGIAISQAISVFVDSDSTGESKEGKNVPKIIIKSYSSDPTLVKAGENFNLSMEFLNTHSARLVRNIKGSFSVTESSSETGNVFTPVGSSNTFYVDKINPQGTATWNVTLYTIPDAKSKTYTMNITFEYEDDLGTQYTATEVIGIPVYQPARFEVSDISVPPETYVGQPVYIGLEMYNLGKTDIYNVKLNVEGDFEAQPKSNYFGNFESGRVEYFEFNLIPMMPGQANGRIIFQYENASGEVQELVKEISMNVMEMTMPPEDFPVDGPGKPGMEEPTEKSFFKSVWFYVIAGVVVAGVVVAIILVRRKRKKDKEFEF